jgi:hypothetical protein
MAHADEPIVRSLAKIHIGDDEILGGADELDLPVISTP